MFTPGPRAFPQAWHGAALGPYLLTRSECERASQNLGPFSSPTRLSCHGEGTRPAQCGGGIGAGWRVDTLTPTVQTPAFS